MIKILDKLREKINNIIRVFKELDAYDKVYFHGKLISALIFVLCILAIGCFILAFIIFD